MKQTVAASKATAELVVCSLWWILRNKENLTIKERVELLKWLPLLARITFLVRRDFGIGFSRSNE